MDKGSETGAICEPCMPSEYYAMEAVCTPETYNYDGVRHCEYRCFGHGSPVSGGPSSEQEEEEESSYFTPTKMLIMFTLYLVVM